MPRRYPLHILAPRSSTAAYCGARPGKGVQVFPQSRAREEVGAGKATRFCPVCLAAALAHGVKASEAGKAGNRARQAALSPDQRREIARRAIATRWDRFRARQRHEPVQEYR